MLVLLLSLISYKSYQRSKIYAENSPCQPGEVLTTITEQTGTRKVKVARPCWTTTCPERWDYVPVYETVTKCVKVVKPKY